MTKKFEASNGVVIVSRPGGSVHWEAGTPPTSVGTALREFFRHERDEELGRWRWPEDQNIVVVLDKANYSGGGKRWVSVYDEREVGKSSWICADTSSKRTRGREPLHDAAHDYFAAHPVSRTWASAKDGEVWGLRVDDGPEQQYIAVDGRFFSIPLREPADATWRPASFVSDFTAGRRIWPEASND